MAFLDTWPNVEGTVYKLAKNVKNKSNTLKKKSFFKLQAGCFFDEYGYVKD